MFVRLHPNSVANDTTVIRLSLSLAFTMDPMSTLALRILVVFRPFPALLGFFLFSIMQKNDASEKIEKLVSRLPSAALSYAKIMQASGKRACSQFPERSLSYTKIMQASAMKTCFQIAECSFILCKDMFICR